MNMNFINDDFERFVREKANKFCMYPSRKVWYSIYNNVHPGNRLPSISMCIILLALLYFIGYLNTNPTQKPYPYQAINQQPALVNTLSKSPTVGNPNVKTQGQHPTQNGSNNILQPSSRKSIAPVPPRHIVLQDNASTLIGKSRRTYLPNTTEAEADYATTNISLATMAIENNSSVADSTEFSNLCKDPASLRLDLTKDKNLKMNSQLLLHSFIKNNLQQTHEIELNNSAVNKHLATSSGIKNLNTQSNTTHKTAGLAISSTGIESPLHESNRSWMEHDILYNRKMPKKWAGKISWQAYITPGIVYRSLYNNAAGKNLSGNAMAFFNSANLNKNIVRHRPSVGLEAGLSLQYDLLKRIKLKGGLQINLTRYNTLAYENHHPISTSLTLNNHDNTTVYEVFRSTNYSNTTGLNEVKLHNQTLQLSLPMGLDYRLTQAGSISWYAGATIQPTIVVFAQSYLISSDRRNYVKDASMLNRFNLNAAFETYVSFKMRDYSWQVGPQFRTQLLSTNNKIYSVEERLMNIGIKAGITKKL